MWLINSEIETLYDSTAQNMYCKINGDKISTTIQHKRVNRSRVFVY